MQTKEKEEEEDIHSAVYWRYFRPMVEFAATEREGMKRRMKFFKSNCFQVLHFSRNQKPHSVLWLVDVLNYFNYLMVPPYPARRIVS